MFLRLGGHMSVSHIQRGLMSLPGLESPAWKASAFGDEQRRMLRQHVLIIVLGGRLFAGKIRSGCR